VPEKRFPCRFRDSLGCEKTFTTSGHASRHSKIHTAEKAVPCEFPGCPKKFTRSDNMKQHLDTHFKDKSRGGSGSGSGSASRSSLSHKERRVSTSSSTAATAGSSRFPSTADAATMYGSPLPSPDTLIRDMRELRGQLDERTAYPAPAAAAAAGASRTTKLDTLVMVADRKRKEME
jgi:hypothetical protein